jgi:N-acetylmuramoyl-L-alanine amidase
MSIRAAIRAFACGILLAGAPLLACLASSAEPQTAAPSDFPVASEMRLAGDETHTRLIVDLNHRIDLRVFTLANPYRVIVDLPQVAFSLPDKLGTQGRGLVKAFRYGLVRAGASRIVVDLARPARIEKALVLEPANNQPARLVLELAAVEREVFLRTAALENRAPEARKRPEDGQGKPESDPRPLVVIDPGHGGIDSGTRLAPTDHPEKAIVLELGLLLRDKLQSTGKFAVAMTRSDDSFVALADRVHVARARHAALFVSIHADALARGEGDARGATIYTLSEKASDAAAERLAEAENRADVIAGLDLAAEPDDVADILIDLARRETKTFSVQFARTLVKELKTATKLHKAPLKSASFRVLKAPDVPSVLVELGYVTNGQDMKSLTSVVWRERTADSMMRAIETFFATRTAGNAGNSQ